MSQLSMLDLMRPAPVRLSVEPHGDVVKGPVTRKHVLPHPRMAWDSATIELHKHKDGSWMWGTNYHLDGGEGSGYRVGPKWGKFAPTEEDALYWACDELRQRLEGKDSKCARRVLEWINGLA